MSQLARIVVQRCESAELFDQSQPPATIANINRGLIAFVSFWKNADLELVDKMSKTMVAVRNCEAEASSRSTVSIADLPGDLLIIPQFCLSGKIKGNSYQYHAGIDKTEGEKLYTAFVDQCRTLLTQQPVWASSGCSVQSGVYGNRQVLNTRTNGPFYHILDF